MRHLTLMRHAKAQQPSGEMTDHQRPLSKRGVRQAHAMAYVLQRWQSLAGKVCVSTALLQWYPAAGFHRKGSAPVAYSHAPPS